MFEWRASAELPVWDDADEPTVADPVAEGLALSVSPTDGGERQTILTMNGLVLDMWRIGDAVSALDARSASYARFTCLIDPDDPGELHPHLQEMADGGFGYGAVIIDHVRLAPAWRGLGGVGRLLIGRLLPLVSDNPQVVATQPFPIDMPRNQRGEIDSPEFEPELAKIRRTWESLAFQPYEGEIWVMDPAMAAHAEAIAKLEAELGLQAVTRP